VRVRAETGHVAPTEKTALDAQRLEEIERAAVLDALKKNQFNRTETAKTLGISRRALLYKLQRLRAQGYEVDPKPGGDAA
jgi:DNA-binding NtrC family response regulator